jgi:arylsulfatase A-like enzyme/Tfp pilus assembly protein PilF
MKIKYFIASFAVLLIGAATIFFLTRPGAKSRPTPNNLLLITMDTMRADHLGCYGDGLAMTPAIDALAREGILFENCYSPVPLTLPAHCSILTGRWPIGHGVRNNGSYKLAAEQVALAEMFKAAGYDTAAIIAAYVLKNKFGLAQGFDHYDDRLAYEEKAGNIDAEITADRVYDKFRQWLQRRRNQPSFLWVHFYDPHKPYAPPADYLQRAGGDAYRGEVAFMDHAIGRMVKDLKEQQLYERTLIVVAGDHGEAFGEHGEKGHGIFCYDETLRVPLILANPVLFKKAARVSRPVSLVDIVPTVLELLGIAADKSWQGESLVAPTTVVEGNPRSLYFESMYGRELKNWAPLTGLIQGDFKYISLPRAELYDLKTDRYEKTNLFFKDNLRARQMDRALARFIQGQPATAGQEAHTALNAEDRSKLAALGYISSFAPAGRAGTDPKSGIGYEARFAELSVALDRGETARVEAEALRLRDETADSSLSLAYIMLNYVYQKKQQWDKLEANLLRACELFKDSPGQALIFRINLLESYFSGGRFEAAEELAETMLRADPEKTRVLEILGQISEKRRDWPSALKWYSQANRIEVNNAALAKKVINMLMQTGDKWGAMAASEKLLQDEGGDRDADLLFTTAMLAVETGNSARSEALLLRLTEIQPTARRWFDYALLLGRNNKFSAAVAFMEKALAAAPNDLDDERRQAAARALQAWKGRLK